MQCVYLTGPFGLSNNSLYSNNTTMDFTARRQGQSQNCPLLWTCLWQLTATSSKHHVHFPKRAVMRHDATDIRPSGIQNLNSVVGSPQVLTVHITSAVCNMAVSSKGSQVKCRGNSVAQVLWFHPVLQQPLANRGGNVPQQHCGK